MHVYVRQEAAWIRSRTSASRTRSANGTRSERLHQVDSAATHANLKEQPHDKEATVLREPSSTGKQEGWVDDYVRMCTNSMDLRQNFVAAEKLLLREETPIGPSAESCKRALVHLDAYLQQNSMNLRARLMQRRAVGLGVRHRLGRENVEIVLAVAQQHGVMNEAEITRLMADLADEGFDETVHVDADGAKARVTSLLSTTSDQNGNAGQRALPGSARRAPGAERREPLSPTGAAARYGTLATSVATGFDSMALGRMLIFPDGTSRPVFTEAAYEEALEQIKRQRGRGSRSL